MALNSNYMIAPSLQSYFVSKDTGLPLTNGYIYFYIDGTNIPKPVYELSGTYPDYTYTVLPNPLPLSSVGTPTDPQGNDIIIYYFPFDGTANIPGNVQLYTIAVYDSNGVLQFTRNAWPNFEAGSISTSDELINLIPNGQFALHNNIPASSANGFVPNQISQSVTNIAPGNWFFEIPAMSSSVNQVEFIEYNTSIGNPTGNPKYAVQITTAVSSDSIKDLGVRYSNVNTFSSSTIGYNLYFEGMANNSAIDNVQVLIKYNYGTGGSPDTPDETVVTSVALDTTMQGYNVALTFPQLIGASIGTNNDDYVEIAIRLPPTAAQVATFTNFALILNNDILDQFPTETQEQQVNGSIANTINQPNQLPSVLNPNGIVNFDTYLPMVWTQNGIQADHSCVGKIYGAVYTPANIGELLCDGSEYLTSDFDTNGIPYARLQNVLYAQGVALGFNIPLYGTGANFASCYPFATSAFSSYFRIATNKPGAQTGIVDTGGTGFTIVPINTGMTTNVTAYSSSTIGITVYGNAVGIVGANAADVNVGGGISIVQQVNASLAYQVFTIDNIPAGAAITSGHYFTFNTSSGTNYYVWYNVNGAGGNPSPGGRTGIQVAIQSTYNAQDVASLTKEAINGVQSTRALALAAASIPGGSYFTFGANSTTYYVWYEVGGIGTTPSGSTAQTAIKVTLGGSENADQVASATEAAVNNFMFAVPDFRGLFLRGRRGTGQWDLNSAARWSSISGLGGNFLGTFESDNFRQHAHSATTTGTIPGIIQNYCSGGGSSTYNTTSAGTTNITASTTIGVNGGAETQPLNAYVNWYIKM